MLLSALYKLCELILLILTTVDCVIASVQRLTTAHLTLVLMVQRVRHIQVWVTCARVCRVTMELTARHVSFHDLSTKQTTTFIISGSQRLDYVHMTCTQKI